MVFSQLFRLCCSAPSASTSSRPPSPLLALRAPLRHFSSTRTVAAKKAKKMPPKKAVQEKKALLGRPGNNLKIGIVGLFQLAAPETSASLLHAFSRPAQRRKVLVLQRPLQDRYVFLVRDAQLPLTVLLDLGVARNFPYATIDPEVRLAYPRAPRRALTPPRAPA